MPAFIFSFDIFQVCMSQSLQFTVSSPSHLLDSLVRNHKTISNHLKTFARQQENDGIYSVLPLSHCIWYKFGSYLGGITLLLYHFFFLKKKAKGYFSRTHCIFFTFFFLFYRNGLNKRKTQALKNITKKIIYPGFCLQNTAC